MTTATEKDIEKRISGFAGKFSPEICEFAKGARSEIRRILPNAIELVYDNYNALAFAFGPNEKASEAVLSIAVYPRWVSLFFARGAKLPDPLKLLKGSGTRMRHMVLDSDKISKNPYLIDMIRKAVASHPTAIPPGKGYTIIKSISATQRPRRPVATGLKNKKRAGRRGQG